MTDFIKVSELTHYMICPRLVYFSAHGHEKPKIAEGKEQRIIEHILLKELGFNLHKMCGDDDDENGKKERIAEESIKQMIGEIVDGVQWI
jgi:CRISPR/Cas system-associated exonuclease Cas4 (RecB family)